MLRIAPRLLRHPVPRPWRGHWVRRKNQVFQFVGMIPGMGAALRYQRPSEVERWNQRLPAGLSGGPIAALTAALAADQQWAKQSLPHCCRSVQPPDSPDRVLQQPVLALFSAAAEDTAGGSETSALPMAARGCRLSEPARAGFQPFTQNSRHAKRTAIPPERAATRANLEYRSLGIGSSITGVHVAAYYTAAHGASSGQRRFGIYFSGAYDPVQPGAVHHSSIKHCRTLRCTPTRGNHAARKLQNFTDTAAGVSMGLDAPRCGSLPVQPHQASGALAHPCPPQRQAA